MNQSKIHLEFYPFSHSRKIQEEQAVLGYLICSKLHEQDADSEGFKQVLASISMCNRHQNKKVEYLCFDATCKLERRMCGDCLLEHYNKEAGHEIVPLHTFPKLIEKYENSVKRLPEGWEDQIIKKLDQYETEISLELDLFCKEQKDLVKSLVTGEKKKIRAIKEHQRLELSDYTDPEELILKNLNSFSSLMVKTESNYDIVENLDVMGERAFKNIEELQKTLDTVKTDLANKMEALKELFTQGKVSSKYEYYSQEKEKLIKGRPSNEVKKKPEEELKISISKSSSQQSKLLKAVRLPKLPPKNNSETVLWPIIFPQTKSCVKDQIKFTTLKERVQLWGIVQYEIVKFHSVDSVAKLCVFVFENDKEIHQQEFSIEKSNNKLANDLIFSKGLPLNQKTPYRMELFAKEGFGCESRYGLNNEGRTRVEGVFEFIDVKQDYNSEFMTDTRQGLFPELLYKIE